MTEHRGLTDEDLESLTAARRWLAEQADTDCYCVGIGQTPTSDDCCDSCRAREALRQLDQVLEPRPRSLHPERLTNPTERVYYEHWLKTNERLNHGATTLEWILSTAPNRPGRPTQRDWDVATAVIQWLGTNCGNGFVRECEAKIQRLDDLPEGLRRPNLFMGPYRLRSERLDPGEESAARNIATSFLSIEEHPSAVDALTLAIAKAIKHYQWGVRQPRPDKEQRQVRFGNQETNQETQETTPCLP